VGAQLARLELNVAISSLLARLPAIARREDRDQLTLTYWVALRCWPLSRRGC
jgi:cytochrome P450